LIGHAFLAVGGFISYDAVFEQVLVDFILVCYQGAILRSAVAPFVVLKPKDEI